jgi:hypothetical protein
MVINIHCNTRPDSLIFQEILIATSKAKDALWKMVRPFGVTTVVDETPFEEDSPPTLANLVA